MNRLSRVRRVHRIDRGWPVGPDHPSADLRGSLGTTNSRTAVRAVPPTCRSRPWVSSCELASGTCPARAERWALAEVTHSARRPCGPTQ